MVKFLVIRIPKSGTTSISGAMKVRPPQAAFAGMPSTVYLPVTHPLMVANGINKIKVAFLRDPLERALSLYFWLRNVSSTPDILRELKERAIRVGPDEFWEGINSWEVNLNLHLWTQHTFIENALGGIELYRFEDIGKAWDSLLFRSPGEVGKLPHLNHTSLEKRRPADFLTAKAIRNIRRIYEADFRLRRRLPEL